MSRRTEIQVGLTVLVALVVLLWGVTWLKDMSLHSRVHIWHVTFPQTGGLGASDEVQVNGIRKGAVAKIALVGDHCSVDLGLSTEVVLTHDCRVAIRNVGLMGEHVIAVDLRTTGVPYAATDTIPGIYELGMPEVMASMGTSMDAVNRVAAQLDRVANNLRTSGDLEKTLTNFREASEDLRAAVGENRKLLHDTIADVNAVAKTAKDLTAERQEQFRRTLDSVERSSHNIEALSSRLDSLRAVAQAIANKTNGGDGTIGRLLNDHELYDEVRSSVKAMHDVLDDLKKNPKKYINLRIF